MWDAELRGQVAILTYTRPPENALGFADLAQLDATLQRWGRDERARVIVLAASACETPIGTSSTTTATSPSKSMLSASLGR